MSKFKKEENFIIERITEITVGNEKVIKLYKDMFSKMSDKDFTSFMERLRDGDILQILVETDMSKNKITVENNLRLAKKYNYPLFQHTYSKVDKSLPKVETKEKQLILLLPFRRTKQTVEKGVSVSEDNKHHDIITGQPTGVSRSSKISGVEAQLLTNKNLINTVEELMIDRSDLQRSSIMIGSIKKYGTVSPDVLKQYGEQTRTSKTLQAYLAGMHMKLSL